MTWWWRNCLKASIHSLRIVLSLTSDFVSRFHQIKISFLACAWLKNFEIEKPKHWQLMNQSCDTESVLYKNVCVSELLPNIRIWKQSFILTEFLKNNWSCTSVIAGWFINFCFGFSVPRVILQFQDFKLYFNKCWIYGSCVTLASITFGNPDYSIVIKIKNVFIRYSFFFKNWRRHIWKFEFVWDYAIQTFNLNFRC